MTSGHNTDFGFLFGAARRSVRWIVAGTAVATAVALSNVVLLALSGWFITAMALAGLGHIALDVFAPAALIRALAILRTGGRYAERYITHDATLRLLGALRQRLFERISPLAPAALAGWRSSDLLARLRADIDDLDNAYLRLWVPIAGFAISMPALGAFEWRTSPTLAMINLSGIVAVNVLMPITTLVIRRGIDQKKGQLRADLYGHATETAACHDELLVDGALSARKTHGERLASSLDRLRRREASVVAGGDALAGVLAQIAIMGSLLTTITLYLHDHLTAPRLVLLFTLSLASFELAGSLPTAIQSWGKTRVAAERVSEIVNLPVPIIEEGDRTEPPPTFDLTLHSLEMAYATRGSLVLCGLDLTVAPGELVILHGPSGTGKSSLFNAIMRFWPLRGGALSLGGIEATQFTLDAWRSFFTLAEQASMLFHDTIRANLLVANPDAPDTALMQALRDAAILDEVAAMPDGLDTLIGERETGLSGGQARRIALARTFLKPAPILLLDEPTENLDVDTAREVMNNLARIAANGRTVIVISHRPATLSPRHRILTMTARRLEPTSATMPVSADPKTVRQATD